MSFTVALKEDPEAILDIKRVADAVSDPDSPRYGDFLTPPKSLA
jgi:hypothetical protein